MKTKKSQMIAGTSILFTLAALFLLSGCGSDAQDGTQPSSGSSLSGVSGTNSGLPVAIPVPGAGSGGPVAIPVASAPAAPEVSALPVAVPVGSTSVSVASNTIVGTLTTGPRTPAVTLPANSNIGNIRTLPTSTVYMLNASSQVRSIGGLQTLYLNWRAGGMNSLPNGRFEVQYCMIADGTLRPVCWNALYIIASGGRFTAREASFNRDYSSGLVSSVENGLGSFQFGMYYTNSRPIVKIRWAPSSGTPTAWIQAQEL